MIWILLIPILCFMLVLIGSITDNITIVIIALSILMFFIGVVATLKFLGV